MNGWIEKSLGDLFDFSGGLSASRAQLSDKGYPYLHYGDIHASIRPYIDVCNDSSIPRLDIDINKVSNKSLLDDGDVVFVDASEDDEGASRHVVVRNEGKIPFISGLHTIVAKAKTDDLDERFREFCFQTTAVKSQFKFYAVGTKVTGVSKSTIGKIMICFPKSKTEQRAIAAALSDADEYIAMLEKLIAKKRAVKQGAMQELLTGKRRLPGFEGEWMEKKVIELAKIFGRIGFRGYTKQDIVKEKQGAISLSPSNIENGKVNFYNSTYISWEKYKESPEIILQVGDVVLVKTGSTFGKTAYIDFLPWEATINPQMVVFKEITTDSRFFGYLLAFDEFQKQINDTIVGGAIPTLSQAQVYKFILKIPPTVAEQAAIATVLSDMDAEIDVLTAKLEKARRIKQGMMSELLSGRIRLIKE
ncbi:restriction endonuclease subunit S [Brevibacillus parabrevis]|uniref:restriction endonuclease subunit S n=1 Tax=Brevibacillus parabrevis TaxID=54914 RepID=UPI001F6258FC|nr:restriction endonuclease subunit S [Brevibacillus parabrevis]